MPSLAHADIRQANVAASFPTGGSAILWRPDVGASAIQGRRSIGQSDALRSDTNAVQAAPIESSPSVTAFMVV